MIAQYYYTSSAHRLDGGKGFGPRAKSPGLQSADLAEIGTFVTYDEGRKNLRDPVNTFPPSFSFGRLPSGRWHISSITFVGRDYSGRDGNYFLHSLVLDDLDDLAPVGGAPIALFGAGLWCTSEEGLPEKLELADLSPEQLAQFPLPLSRAAVAEFVAANPGLVAEALQAVASNNQHRRRTVIVDAAERLPLWIAALTLPLPSLIRRATFFETFRGNPEMSPAHVVGSTSDISMSLDDLAYRTRYALFNVLEGRRSEGFTPGKFAKTAVNAMARNRWEFLYTLDRLATNLWPDLRDVTELDELTDLALFAYAGADLRAVPAEQRRSALGLLARLPAQAVARDEGVIARVLQALQMASGEAQPGAEEVEAEELRLIAEVLTATLPNMTPEWAERCEAALITAVCSRLLRPESVVAGLALLEDLTPELMRRLRQRMTLDQLQQLLEQAHEQPPGRVLGQLLEAFPLDPALGEEESKEVIRTAAEWVEAWNKPEAAETITARLIGALDNPGADLGDLVEGIIRLWTTRLPDKAADLLSALISHRPDDNTRRLLAEAPYLIANIAAGKRLNAAAYARALTQPAFRAEGGGAAEAVSAPVFVAHLQALLAQGAAQGARGVGELVGAVAEQMAQLRPEDADRLRRALIQELPADGSVSESHQWIMRVWGADLIHECGPVAVEKSRPEGPVAEGGKSQRPAQRILYWYEHIFDPQRAQTVMLPWLRDNGQRVTEHLNNAGCTTLMQHPQIGAALARHLTAQYFANAELAPLEVTDPRFQRLTEWLNEVGDRHAGDLRVWKGWVMWMLSQVKAATAGDPGPAMEALSQLSARMAHFNDDLYERALMVVLSAVADSPVLEDCAPWLHQAYDGKRFSRFVAAMATVAGGDSHGKGRRSGRVFGTFYAAEPPTHSLPAGWNTEQWDNAFRPRFERYEPRERRAADRAVQRQAKRSPEMWSRWQRWARVDSVLQEFMDAISNVIFFDFFGSRLYITVYILVVAIIMRLVLWLNPGWVDGATAWVKQRMMPPRM